MSEIALISGGDILALVLFVLAAILPLSLLSLGVAGMVAEWLARKSNAPRYAPVFSAAWLALVIGRAAAVWFVLSHSEIFGWFIPAFVPELLVYLTVASHSPLNAPLEVPTATILLIIGLDALIAGLVARPIAASARRYRAKAARAAVGLILGITLSASYLPGGAVAVGFFCFAYPFLQWLSERRTFQGKPIPKGAILAGAVAISLAVGYVFRVWFSTRTMN